MLRWILQRKRGQTRGPFVCHVRKGLDEETRIAWRAACEGLDFYGEHEGERYCVLHHPGEGKREALRETLKWKLAQKSYNFSGTYFPSGTADFHNVTFDAEARFNEAVLDSAWFADAQFCDEVVFERAEFHGANFFGTKFRGHTTFLGAKVGGEATFTNASFGGNETNFHGAEFRGPARFLKASFGGLARFTRAKFGGFANFADAHLAGTTWFNEVAFRGGATFASAIFSGDETAFDRTTFKSANFNEAKFSGAVRFGAKFQGRADITGAKRGSHWVLDGATFNGRADFSGADFSSDAHFGETQFADEAKFIRAIFRAETHFTTTEFRGPGADFSGANFYSVAAFFATRFGPETRVRFDNCWIDEPGLLKFNTVQLHPSWFVNADVRKVDFTDVSWYGLWGGPIGSLDAEIRALQERGIVSPHHRLAEIYQSLALLAEDNRDYAMAGEFYYWSMDVLRRYSRWQFGPLNNLYWALSGYGERIRRAFGILATICVAFAVLYMWAGPSELQVYRTSEWRESIQHAWQAIVYSLGVLFRLSPDPKPNLGFFQLLVTIESIIGPLQIAVLLLAIRRKILRQRIFQ